MAGRVGQLDWNDCAAVDARFPILANALIEAFELDGGCGHDLGLSGALAIVREWERIRTRAMADAVQRIRDVQ